MGLEWSTGVQGLGLAILEFKDEVVDFTPGLRCCSFLGLSWFWGKGL